MGPACDQTLGLSPSRSLSIECPLTTTNALYSYGPDIMPRLPPSTGSLYCSSHSVESPLYSPPTLSPHPRYPFTLIFPLHPPHSPRVLPLSVTSFSCSYRLQVLFSLFFFVLFFSPFVHILRLPLVLYLFRLFSLLSLPLSLFPLFCSPLLCF